MSAVAFVVGLSPQGSLESHARLFKDPDEVLFMGIPPNGILEHWVYKVFVAVFFHQKLDMEFLMCTTIFEHTVHAKKGQTLSH